VTIKILIGDSLEILRTLPAESVHCVVTSPPYWGLRDYGVEGQMGLESTPAEFISNMVAVFDEVRRVLRSDGTCWVNMGDSYLPGKNMAMMPHRLAIALQDAGWWVRQDIVWSKPNPMPESVRDRCTKSHEYIFLLTKSAQYFYDAEAIREPVTESTIARLSQDVENQAGSDRVPGKTNGTMKAVARGVGFGHGTDANERGRGRVTARDTFKRENSNRAEVFPGQTLGTHRPDREDTVPDGFRSKRSVWTMATHSFKEAHFATFPPELPETCIKAGTSERGHCPVCGGRWLRQIERKFAPQDDVSIGKGKRGSGDQKPMDQSNTWEGFPRGTVTTTTTGWEPGCDCNADPVPDVVLDPFFGAGTTGLVADRLQRDCIGIELNQAYAEMARKRIQAESPLLAQVEVAA